MSQFTDTEDEIIRRHYEAEGPSGLEEFLPGRSKEAIRRRARKLGLKSSKKRGPINKHFTKGTEKVSIDEFLRLKAQIPHDTRDLTGRLCGDPLPGRSALDRLGGTGA